MPQTWQSLSPDLLEMVYDAASIHRWNDQINPMDFTELDKQAHKMVFAYVLARFEEDIHPGLFDWRTLIEGGIFEMLHRVILTDIKPPVFHKMMAEKGRELNAWVFERLEPVLTPVRGGFAQRFRNYFADRAYAPLEKRLLKAAHYLASEWEFSILYRLCPFIAGIEQIRKEIEDKIEDHYDLIGVQKLLLKRRTHGFVELCGQLRFQKRWSQSPRIPSTSVLGHMLVVAQCTYLALQETDACARRQVDGFWGGLFHDLPEALTRDITSPIKESVPGLDDLIKKYECEQMEEKLYPLIPDSWHDDIRYYTEQEFDNRIRTANGDVRGGLSFDDLEHTYNHASARPLDGQVIRTCDHLAAFLEASLSIRHGVTSKHLDEGVRRLYDRYRDATVGPIDFGRVFRHFMPQAYLDDDSTATP